MGFQRLARRLRGNIRGQTPPPPALPLKYSDWLAGAAIVTGVIGSYNAFQAAHPELSGYFIAATTALVALSQWLQSKGD
jgi:hypothetical protein